MTNGRWDWDEQDGRVARRGKKAGVGWAARVGVGVGLLAFAGLVAWGALSLMASGKPAKKQVVQIALLKPPPPPPPPPEIKPPEPEVHKEEVKMPEPEPEPQPAQQDAPPPGEQLGLDAEGGGGNDGFGLAARKGGTDITRLGGAEGGLGRDKLAWFAGMVQSHLQAYFSRNEKLRTADYRIVLRVWFAKDGRIERFELVDSTGNATLDGSIRLAMDSMPPLRQPVPTDIPQPVKLRVTSRGAG
jgi:protein TonB